MVLSLQEKLNKIKLNMGEELSLEEKLNKIKANIKTPVISLEEKLAKIKTTPIPGGGGTAGAFTDEPKKLTKKFDFTGTSNIGIGTKISATGGITLPTSTPQAVKPSLGMVDLGLPAGPMSKPEDKPVLADMNQSIPSIAKGVWYGTITLPQAVGGLMRMWGETEQVISDPSKFVSNPKWEGVDKKIFEAMYGNRKLLNKEIGQAGKVVSEKGQEIIKANKLYASKYLPPDDASKLNKFLFDLGAGASSIGLAVGVSLITGNAGAAAVAFGGMAAGRTYQEAREAGVEPLKASALGAFNFATEAGLEYIGIDFLLKRLPVSKAISLIAKGSSEFIQEYSQETGSNIVAKVGWDKARKWNEGSAKAGAMGFLLGAGSDVIIGSVVKETGAPENFVKPIIDKVYKQMDNVTKGINFDSIIAQAKTDPDVQKTIAEITPEISKVEVKEPTIPKQVLKTQEELKAETDMEYAKQKAAEAAGIKYDVKAISLTKKIPVTPEVIPKVEVKEPVPDEIDKKIRNILDKDKELLAITKEYKKTTKPDIWGSGDKLLLKKEADLYTEKYNKLLEEELKTKLPQAEESTKAPATIEEAREILKQDLKKPAQPKEILAKQMVEKKVSIADIEAVKGEKIDVNKPKDILIALRDIKKVKVEVVKKETLKTAIPEELEGLAEEARNAEEFVKNIPVGETKVYIPINETDNTITILKLDALPQGTGAGTKIINGLKIYADSTGKKLILPDIKNNDFFNKFPWLTPDFTTKYGNTKSYTPAQAASPTTPATEKPAGVEPAKVTTRTEGVSEKVNIEKGKVSGVAERINVEAIEMELTKGFGDLAEFKSSTIKEQAKLISELSIDQARSMIRGETDLPSNIKSSTLVKIMEAQAIKTANGDMLNELATSQLTGETSEAASILSLSRINGSEIDPVKVIQDTNVILQETATKGKQGKSYKEVINEDIKVTKPGINKQTSKANNKFSWTEFIRSIQCK